MKSAGCRWCRWCRTDRLGRRSRAGGDRVDDGKGRVVGGDRVHEAQDASCCWSANVEQTMARHRLEVTPLKIRSPLPLTIYHVSALSAANGGSSLLAFRYRDVLNDF